MESWVQKTRHVLARPCGPGLQRSLDVLGASLGIPALTAQRCLDRRAGRPHEARGRGSGRGHCARGWRRRRPPPDRLLARGSGRDGPTSARGRCTPRCGRGPPRQRRPLPAWVERGATVAIYAFWGGELFTLPVQAHFDADTRFQFVLVHIFSPQEKDAAVADVSTAVAAGALRMRDEHGLSLLGFPLERTTDAPATVEAETVGRVLVDVVRRAGAQCTSWPPDTLIDWPVTKAERSSTRNDTACATSSGRQARPMGISATNRARHSATSPSPEDSE